MKGSWILVALLIVGIPATADAKCKIKVNDEGQAIGKKYTVSATMTTSVRVRFLRDADEYFMDATFRTVLSSIKGTVNEKTPLLLKLVNGEELQLYPADESHTRRSFLGFAVNRKLTEGLYVIPADSLDVMMQTDIEEIVLQFLTDDKLEGRTWKTRKGDRKNFRRGTACIAGKSEQ